MGAMRTPDPLCPLPIPRLAGVEDLDPELAVRIERGADALETRLFGHAPELYKRWIEYSNLLTWKVDLEHRKRGVARLRIARLNRCHY